MKTRVIDFRRRLFVRLVRNTHTGRPTGMYGPVVFSSKSENVLCTQRKARDVIVRDRCFSRRFYSDFSTFIYFYDSNNSNLTAKRFNYIFSW